jgi:hypothetical protein
VVTSAILRLASSLLGKSAALAVSLWVWGFNNHPAGILMENPNILQNIRESMILIDKVNVAEKANVVANSNIPEKANIVANSNIPGKTNIFSNLDIFGRAGIVTDPPEKATPVFNYYAEKADVVANPNIYKDVMFSNYNHIARDNMFANLRIIEDAPAHAANEAAKTLADATIAYQKMALYQKLTNKAFMAADQIPVTQDFGNALLNFVSTTFMLAELGNAGTDLLHNAQYPSTPKVTSAIVNYVVPTNIFNVFSHNDLNVVIFLFSSAAAIYGTYRIGCFLKKV